jgi:Tol biopolymer transport system component
MRSRDAILGEVAMLLVAGTALALAAACGRTMPAAPGQPSLVHEFAVLSSDDGRTQTLWLTDSSDPTARRPIWSFMHSPQWSGGAEVSPDGRSIVYTVLPDAARDPDHEAELHIVDIGKRQAQTLATGIDLRSTLVWSKDGQSISYQRFEGPREDLLLQARGGGEETVVAIAGPGERLLPISVRQDETLAVLYSSNGATLERLQSGTLEPLRQLSNGDATRDFALSPDGKQLAYLTTDSSDGSGLSRGRVVAVDGSTARELPGSWGEIVGVSWDARGRLVAGSTGSAAGLHLANGERLPVSNRAGFLQPLSWSPSGRFLALRAFSGQSGSQPGSASDEILTSDGHLLPLADSGNVRFIGWSADPADSGGGK